MNNTKTGTRKTRQYKSAGQIYLDIQTIKDPQFLISVSGGPITEEDLKHGACYVSEPPKRIIDIL